MREHPLTSLKIIVNFAVQDIPVKRFQPLKISGNCETEIDHNVQYSVISIQVWDILQAADKFKASII